MFLDGDALVRFDEVGGETEFASEDGFPGGHLALSTS